MSLTLIYFTWRQTRLLSLVYVLAISENGFGCIFKLLRDSLVPFSQSKSEFHFLQHFWKKFCLNNLDLFQNRGASYSQSPIRKMTVSVKWYEWCHISDNPRAEQLFYRKIYRNKQQKKNTFFIHPAFLVYWEMYSRWYLDSEQTNA